MELLTAEQREAVRLVREELCCILCGNVFEDPQCLDCKHNFCRECIYEHLRKRESFCPKCRLPTCPSEVTRNQFLQSILVAWKTVELDLKKFQNPEEQEEELEDKAPIPMTHSVSNGYANGSMELPMTLSSRGPVANSKWNIDTAGLKQEEEARQRREQAAALFSPSQRIAAKNAALNTQNGQSAATTPGGTVTATATTTESPAPARTTTAASQVFSPAGASPVSMMGSVMGTQELNGYMNRIQAQNSFLTKWTAQNQVNAQRKEQLRQAAASPRTRAKPTISAVERVQEIMNAATTGSTVGKRKRRIFGSDDEDDSEGDESQTQMPSTIMDSPDLLGRLKGTTLRRKPATPRRVITQLNVESDETDDQEMKGDDDDDDEEKEKEPVGWMGRRRSPAPKPTSRLAAQSPPRVKQTPQKKSPALKTRVLVPSSQPVDYIDMTLDDDDDDNNEDEDDEDVVEESQLPDLTVQHLRQNKRVSQDFAGAIRAFQSNSSNRLHRLSGMLEEKSAPRKPSEAPIGRGIAMRCTSALPSRAPVVTTSKPPLASTSDTSRATSAISPGDFVFVGTDLARDESKMVLIACQNLGARFGREFDLKRDNHTGALTTSVTHLITKAANEDLSHGLRCKRTAKFMRALAEGTYVVDFSWIQASLAAGRWVPEEPYEMSGDIYCDAMGKPRESRLRRARTGQRNDIFQIFRFILLCPPEEFGFQVESLRSIVTHFGASVIMVEDFARMSEERRTSNGKTPIGIVSKELPPEEARAVWNRYRIPIVRVNWIFDSISYLEVLPFDDYYPY
ncbi:hypothetical protein Poli38472_000170 [Pythium oligandrum]|uniref:RING-type E3 ubiquitin transferase BRCA1 n=1 Tax=Pythium oligandrum TaxID=41045 RepID=A0A8K1CCI2_PYTOL|nr:hypothetical protein Poli38472_000170 [Pythium oligandrum]|eukprot:TMW60128.1 hypothetical protein Poli38472_000170 [Pythium oligandrum]